MTEEDINGLVTLAQPALAKILDETQAKAAQLNANLQLDTLFNAYLAGRASRDREVQVLREEITKVKGLVLTEVEELKQKCVEECDRYKAMRAEYEAKLAELTKENTDA